MERDVTAMHEYGLWATPRQVGQVTLKRERTRLVEADESRIAPLRRARGRALFVPSDDEDGVDAKARSAPSERGERGNQSSAIRAERAQRKVGKSNMKKSRRAG